MRMSPLLRPPLAFALAVTVAVAAEAAPASPKAFLEAKIEAAHALARRKVPPGSEAEKKLKSDAKLLIDDMLDWGELTERSLGSHWKKLSEGDRTRFSGLLRQLIEASYRSRLDLAFQKQDEINRPSKVDIDWLEEDLSPDKASLLAKVSSGGDSALVGFSLRRDEERWRVYDVALDELSTLRTYRSNFNKIIRDEGIPGLFTRLEKKIEDIEAGRADLSRSGLSD